MLVYLGDGSYPEWDFLRDFCKKSFASNWKHHGLRYMGWWDLWPSVELYWSISLSWGFLRLPVRCYPAAAATTATKYEFSAFLLHLYDHWGATCSLQHSGKSSVCQTSVRYEVGLFGMSLTTLLWAYFCRSNSLRLIWQESSTLLTNVKHFSKSLINLLTRYPTTYRLMRACATLIKVLLIKFPAESSNRQKITVFPELYELYDIVLKFIQESFTLYAEG